MIYVYRILNDTDNPFLVMRSLSTTGYVCWFSDPNYSLCDAIVRVLDEDACWHAPDTEYALRGKTYELLTTASDIDELRTNYPDLFI